MKYAALFLLLASVPTLLPAVEPDPTLPANVSDDHPLTKVFAMVERELAQIRTSVRDYSCVLVKRERINGKLQKYQYIAAKVRRPREGDGESEQPFAVQLQYLSPKRMAGRRVLFVEGQNNGKMLVRTGGRLLGNAIVRLSPDGSLASNESLRPITDLGFERMALSILAHLTREMEVDLSGQNSQVDYFRDAKIDGRVCTRIRVTHPKFQQGLTFHMADVFWDEALHLPLRVASYDWPRSGSDKLKLITEYNYTKLKINVGLADTEFSETAFEAAPRSADRRRQSGG